MIMKYIELKMTKSELRNIPQFWSKKACAYNRVLRAYKVGRASMEDLFWLLILKGAATCNDKFLIMAEELDDIKDSLKMQVLGLAYNYIGQKDYSLKILNKAVELEPSVENLRSLARGYNSVNDRLKAKDVYMKIIEMDPYHFQANYFLGLYYLDVEDDENRAKFYIDNLKEKWIHMKQVKYLVAYYNYLEGNWNESIGLHKQYIKISFDYNNESIYQIIADCYRELHDKNNAIKYALKTVELDRNNELALEILNQYNVDPKSRLFWNKNVRIFGPANPLFRFLVLVSVMLGIDIHNVLIFSGDVFNYYAKYYLAFKAVFYGVYLFSYAMKLKYAIEIIISILAINIVSSLGVLVAYKFKWELMFVLLAALLLLGLFDMKRMYIKNTQDEVKISL